MKFAIKKIPLTLILFFVSLFLAQYANSQDQTFKINERANTLINTFKTYNVHTIETPHNNARYGTLAAAARLRANDGATLK
jgi:hypothetical protein